MAMEYVYIGSVTRVQILALKDADTQAVINDAVIKMSLYEDQTVQPEASEIAFTSGGTGEILEGDVVEGSVGSAAAEVIKVVVNSGTWAGGNAAGYLSFRKQVGTFEAEDLNVVEGQANIATIAGDSSATETADAGASVKIHLRNHGRTVGDFFRIQGTKNYDGIAGVSAAIRDYVTLDVAWVTAERFKGIEVFYIGISNAEEIVLTPAGSGGNYQGLLPVTLLYLVEGAYYWRFIKIVKGGDTILIRQRIKAAYYLDDE